MFVVSFAASCALVTDLASLGSDSGASDSSPDVARDAADAPLGFCASRGDADALCADFDDGSLAAGWSNVVGATADGGIALSDASFASPPAAARVITATGQASYLDEKTVSAGAVLDFTADVLLDSESTNGTLEIVSIILLAGEYPELLVRQTYGTSAGTSIQENNVAGGDGGRGTVGTYAFSKSILPGTWTTLAIHIEPNDAGTSLTVHAGGQLVVDQVLASSSKWIAGQYTVDVGVYGRTPAGPVDFAFDNVALSVR
jgi:hypothetical protein